MERITAHNSVELGGKLRLQKWMADAGVASRRKCEELIFQGRVAVNGKTAQLGCTIEEEDIVELDGKRISPRQERVVFAFHKPRGVICASSDPQGRKTVLDYFKDQPYRLYNVGRLDYDSEGLLLITNDGDLAYCITHPKYQMEKCYHVVCDAMLTQAQFRMLEEGVQLSDGVTAPATVANAKRLQNGHYAFDLTIHEGKNREIRRMMEAMGRRTIRLQRIRIGNIRLGGLKSGAWRLLTKEEIIGLYELCK